MDHSKVWTMAIAILEPHLRGIAILIQQQARLACLTESRAVIAVAPKWLDTFRIRHHVLAAALSVAAGRFLFVELVPEQE